MPERFESLILSTSHIIQLCCCCSCCSSLHQSTNTVKRLQHNTRSQASAPETSRNSINSPPSSPPPFRPNKHTQTQAAQTIHMLLHIRRRSTKNTHTNTSAHSPHELAPGVLCVTYTHLVLYMSQACVRVVHAILLASVCMCVVCA